MQDFSHLEFTVSNARTAATYFITHFGFNTLFVKSLETGSRSWAIHAVKQNDIVFVFRSSVDTDYPILDALQRHGDHVSKICVTTSNKNGACTYVPSDDSSFHIQVDTKDGFELPEHYAKIDDINQLLPFPHLMVIDHVVSNFPRGYMQKECAKLQSELGMTRFWSVDDSQIHTEYSSLQSIVMSNENGHVKLPINEPADGKKKSQIQEYLDYNNAAGVQHIALRTLDVITSVRALRQRGVKFLRIPDVYYTDVKVRLSKSKVTIKEDLDTLQELGILIDFDDNGYLLQIFTESMDYRPTVFFEIIQRENFSGFGAGNFLHLFMALEKEQESRGNLTDV